MELIILLIGIFIVIATVLKIFLEVSRNPKKIAKKNIPDTKKASNSKIEHDEENHTGSGFYLNKIDAMSHGAMFKQDGDDDGPGFYM